MERKLIALDTFCYPYGRETVQKGQRFEAVSDADAEALVLAQKARRDDGVPEQRRGRYKTRDLQADA